MRVRVNISGGQSDYYSYNRLRGCIHKWLGENNVHDGISLYSFSWVINDRCFYFSTPVDKLMLDFLAGLQRDATMFNGFVVDGFDFVGTDTSKPFYRCPTAFHVKDNGKYLYFDGADNVATRIANQKLKLLGINGTVNVSFAPNGKNKMFDIHKIKVKCFQCPVRLYGDDAAKQAILETGIGNLTGCGFGHVH